MQSLWRTCLLALAAAGAMPASDVLTERNNNERTGAVEDAVFNPATFRAGWGKRGEMAVTGRVYAQPLYVEGVATPSGRRNLVYVATASNQVSAFDAVSLARVWGPLNLGPNDRSNIGNPRLGCDWIAPDGIGIEATPVIDTGLQRMYVSYRVNNSPGASDPLAGKQMLRAIDIRTGEATGPAVEVHPAGFNPIWERSRASLLELGGAIYVAYSSRCEDIGAWRGQSTRYHGYILAYDAQSLALLGTYAVTPPDVDGGGIWQASTGLASDGTSIYYISGNRRSEFDGKPRSLDTRADSIVRVAPARSGASVTFTEADWFTPYRRVWMDAVDLDLGAAGPMVIPGTKYMVGGGKEGLLYVLDRTNMGKLDGKAWTDAQWAKVHADSTMTDWNEDYSADHVVQKLRVGFQQYIPDNPSYLAPPGAPMAAAMQMTDQWDVFTVGRDGGVYVTWERGNGAWSDGQTTGGWNARPYPARITPANLAPPGAPVAAAKQGANQLDAFVVGKDGAIWVTWVGGYGHWTDGSAGNKATARITGANFAPPGACLATANQGANQLDVLVVGNDGGVWVSWVVGGGAWAGPVRIGPANLAPPGSCVAAAHQNDNQLDAFVTGKDGAVNVVWVVGGGTWAGPVRITPANLSPAGAPVAAAKQTGNQLDAFVTGRDGGVYVTWVAGGGAWATPARITPAGAAAPGSSLAVAAQGSNQLDLFFVDAAGVMKVTWAVGTAAWTPAPVAIAPNGLFPGGAKLVAANQNGNQLDVFAVGQDGAIRVTWVVGLGHWTDGSAGQPPPTRLSRALWMDEWALWPHIHGTPVFGKFADGSAMLYVWPEKDHLKAYPWLGTRLDDAGKKLGVSLNGQLAIGPDGMPGGMLALAVSPNAPRAGVLFAAVTNSDMTDGPGELRAFDAATLRELWNNGGEAYQFSKFVPPTIGGGRAFLPTCSGKVLVYGK